MSKANHSTKYIRLSKAAKIAALFALFVLVFSMAFILPNGELNIANADWSHPGSGLVTIGDNNSGGRNTIAMDAFTSVGTTQFYGSTDTTNKYGIYMSSGGSGDMKTNANTVAIDQGQSSSSRTGMVYFVVPLSANMQHVINKVGGVTLTFSGYIDGANNDYCTYTMFAYSSSYTVSAGTSYSHSTFKSSILSSGSNGTPASSDALVATGNSGYAVATNVEDTNWDSPTSFRRISANVVSGAKSLIFGVMVKLTGNSFFNQRHMDITLSQATVTISSTDTAAPVLTQNSEGSAGFAMTDNLSGIQHLKYSRNGAAQQTATLDYGTDTTYYRSATWTAPKGGVYDFVLVDNVGNQSTYNILVYPTYSGGDGSSDNPYLIATQNDLEDLQATVNAGYLNGYSGYHFKVSANLSLGSFSYTSSNITMSPSKILSYSNPGKQDSENYQKLFDNNSGTKYYINNANNFTIVYDYGTSLLASGFTLTCANDTQNYSSRNFAYFRLRGSNDNSNWTVLHTMSSGFPSTNYSSSSYTMSNPGVYRYYELYAYSSDADEIQMADFYLRTKTGGWTPIGSSASTPFKGTFDGNGKTISGININSNSNYQGLFGYINGATVQNLTVSGSISANSGFVGGIAGVATNGASVSNCVNNISITAIDNVGGIVGYMPGGTISGCINNAVINAMNYTGGIAGDARGAISGSNNGGSVTGSALVGGIAGYATAVLTSCYNTGNISSTGYTSSGGTGANLGGIAGYSSAAISNCYNTGTVTTRVNGVASSYNSANNVGGIVGYTASSVSYSYNSGTVGGASNVGGIAGFAAGDLNYVYNVGGTVNALWDNSGAAIGTIYGGKSGANLSWDIITRNTSGSSQPAFSYAAYLINGTSDTEIKPIYGASFDDCEWNDIISNNINGVKIVIDAEYGKYSGFTDSDSSSSLVRPTYISSSDDGNKVVTTAKFVFDTNNGGTPTSVYAERYNLQINQTEHIYDGNSKTLSNYLETATGVSGIDLSKESVKNVNDSGDVDLSAFIYSTNAPSDKTVTGKNSQSYNVQKRRLTLTEVGSVGTFTFMPSTAQGITGFSVSNNIENASAILTVELIGGYSSEGGFDNSTKYSGLRAINADKYELKVLPNSGLGNNYEIISSSQWTWTINKFDITQDTKTDIIYKGKSNHISDSIYFYNDNVKANNFEPYLLFNYGQSDAAALANHLMTSGLVQIMVDNVSITQSEGTVSVAVTYGTTADNVTVASISVMAGGKNFSGQLSYENVFFTSSDFGGGSGSGESPYIISHWAHLLRLSQIVNGDAPWDTDTGTDNSFVGKSFFLETDLVVSSSNNTGAWNVASSATGYGFNPIGSSTKPFSGIFDGGGKSIALSIALPQNNYVGLFGYVAGGSGFVSGEYVNYGVVKNLSVTGSVTGGNHVGGIAGYLSGTISGCANYASVTGNNYVGGVAGRSNSGAISNCYNGGAVKYSGSTAYAGGILGWLVTGDVSYCVNAGSLNTDGVVSANIGPVIGIIGGGNISCIYNVSTVLGGVVGQDISSGNAQISKAFSVYSKNAAPSSFASVAGQRVVYDSAGELKPVYMSEDATTATSWAGITEHDIIGFEYTADIADGKYLSIRSSETADRDNLIAPYFVSSSLSYQSAADDFTSQTLLVGAVLTADGLVDGGYDYIYINLADMTYESHAVTYDRNPHSVFEKEINEVFAGLFGGNYSSNVYYGFSSGFSTDLPINAEAYAICADIVYFDGENYTVIGRKTKETGVQTALNLIINRASVIDPDLITFGYTGIASNTSANEVGSALNNGSSESDVISALVYSDGGYAFDAFKLLYDGVYLVKDSEVVFQNEAGGVISSLPQDLLGTGNTIVLEGIGNYVDKLYVSFVLMESDFGYAASYDPATWGESEANPYVVEHWAHLVRLSEIVSGKPAWDSTGGASFADRYFKISDSLTVLNADEDYGFAPIGSNTSPFSGTFDGNSKSVNLNLADNFRTTDYVGLFGYISGSSVSRLSVTGSVYGKQYVGGAAGYALNSTLNFVTNYSKVTSAGGHAGGIAGRIYCTEASLSFATLTNEGEILSLANNVGGIAGSISGGSFDALINRGKVSGNAYAGGIAGTIASSGVACVFTNLTNSGAVSSTANYAGGIAGSISGSSVDNAQNSAAVTAGASYVGGIAGYLKTVTLTKVLNSAAVTGNTTYSDYAGGIAGYAETNCVIDGGTETDVYGITNSNKVTGANYVGGIMGYAKDSELLGNVKNDAYVEGTDYVGGIIGRYEGSAALENVNYSNSCPSSQTQGGDGVRVKGAYGGGIFGYTGSSVSLASGTIKNTASVDSEVGGGAVIGGIVGFNRGNIYATMTVEALQPVYSRGTATVSGFEAFGTGSFAGGIAGVNTGTIQNAAFKYVTDGSVSSAVISTVKSNYLGGIVGFNTGSISNCTVESGTRMGSNGDGNVNGGSHVGGIAGYSAGAVENCSTGARVAGSNYLGGVVGYLAYGGNLVGDYTNRIEISGADYVGGIIGAVESGAGAYSGTGNIYDFGVGATYGNFAAITASGSWAGGIFGAVGYGVDSSGSGAAEDGYYTRYYATSVNEADITASGDYAGGLFGEVKSMALLYLANGTHNGIAASGQTTVSAANYAGGIAGKLSNERHEISNVFNTALITASASCAGGLVGYMDGGTVSGSFSTLPDYSDDTPLNITVDTDTVSAASYAGGLIGYFNNGTISDSYSQGFKFTRVSVTSGGVAGYKHATNAAINECWTIYIAGGAPTYSTTSANKNGKFVILDSRVANLMSVQELMIVTGIIAQDPLDASVSRNATFVSSSNDKMKGLMNDISLKLTIPSGSNGINAAGGTQYQLVFYNASGYERKTNNVFTMESVSLSLYTRLLNSSDSFSVCLAEIVFQNVNDLSSTESWENCYIQPNNDENYSASITNITSSNNVYTITGWISFNGYLIAEFTRSYSHGSEVAPILITSLSDWTAFVADIKNGVYSSTASERYRAYVKLTTDISVSSPNLLAGDISVGEDADISTLNNRYFSGTFDGDGHTITVNITGSSSPRLSLFPNAANAVFKNLTIAGIISTTGFDVAGFVGKPFGDLEFYNCTNDANISALRLASGFASYTRSFQIYAEACINNGNITTTETTSELTNYVYGTGGIIANVESTTTIESCKNTGNITGGGANVGGIVGRTDSALTVRNSANTGDIKTTQYGMNIWSCAGGILGRTAGNGIFYCYSSYNTGTVQAESNIAGGIVGSLGDYDPAHFDWGWYGDKVATGGKSVIAYSYNTGDVSTGGTSAKGGENWFGGYVKLSGTEAGGIVGLVSSVDISYVYNTGEITSYGCGGYAGSWQIRIGGIIGQSHPNDSTYNVNIKYSYNIGKIVNAENTDSGCRYGAGIVGYMDNDTAVNNTNISNTYSIKNQFLMNGSYSDYNKSGGDYDKWTKSGTILDSLADYTAVNTGSTNRIAPQNSTLTSSFGSTGSVASLTSDTSNAYLNGTAGGWVYAYGCLPQISVFALDTPGGLSMHSISYGLDTYNNYVKQTSGDEFSPYIIKDGIDLLSLSALSAASDGYVYWTCDDKYIEFADGKNNVATAITPEHRTDTTAAIDMSNFKYSQNLSVSQGYYQGKSWHLYALGAAGRYIGSPSGSYLNSSNLSVYDTWKARNYYYNGSAWTTGATFENVNFYPIAMKGGSNAFKGTISGAQTTTGYSNTLIKNLKIVVASSATSRAGLFGYTEDASVSNISSSGTVTAYALSTASKAYAGGITAIAANSSTLANLGAGARIVIGSNIYTHTLAVTTRAVGSDSVYTVDTAAGGIAGRVTTESGKSGDRLEITGCTSIANVSTFSKNMGGIWGYASGIDSTTVYASDCAVVSGEIKSNSGRDALYFDTRIGGIGGGRSGAFTLALEQCRVGSQTALVPVDNQSLAKVIIKGAYIMGGMLGEINGDTTLRNCSVYGDVWIEKEKSANHSATPVSYGTAVGGLAGYSDTSCVVDGTTVFSGTINIATAASGIVNVGGMFGYMGAGTSIASGTINVNGKIVGFTGLNARNIGGIAGLATGVSGKEVVFNGTYTISPTINMPLADHVGGFIGQNAGIVYILAGARITIGTDASASSEAMISAESAADGDAGTVIGRNYVGGFIGYNALNTVVEIGVTSYKGVPYTGTSQIGNYASIDGKEGVGGIIGYNAGEVEVIQANVVNDGVVGAGEQSAEILSQGASYVGGVIGYNTEGASVSFSEKSSLTNLKQVGHNDYMEAAQFYVGGILGATAGAFSIAQNAVLTNAGSVYGYRYVGGIIGRLIAGTISGKFANSQTGASASGEASADNSVVMAYRDVGGVIGIVEENGSIGLASFENSGSVTGGAYQNQVYVGGMNVGGMIGVFYGSIAGAGALEQTSFTNNGKVMAHSYSGGAIGVLAGSVTNAVFVNSGELEFVGGDALGGSIGHITDGEDASVVVLGTHFEYVNSAGSAGETATTSMIASGVSTQGVGGVGGVIGLIDAESIASAAQWSGNTFYVNGSVTAEKATYVGGVVGKIDGAYVTIKNMLVFENTIIGYNYVGGIVGYNGSKNGNSGVDASLVECYNIRGEVKISSENASPKTAELGGIVGGVSSADINYTYSCYWVKNITNSALVNTNIHDITNTLNAIWTTVITRADYINPDAASVIVSKEQYHDVVDENGNYFTDWEDYIEAWQSANGKTLVTNNNGDLGYYTEGEITYTTGSARTGYYFVYASDGVMAAGATAEVDVVDPADLAYWKYIANAYSINEEVPSERTSPLKLSIDGTAPVGVNGKIEQRHIYAVAYAAQLNGYYLYMATATNTGMVVNYYDGAFYSEYSSTTNTNVMIYYKKLAVINKLTYNGVERIAPLDGLDGYASEPAAGAVSGYYYILNGGSSADKLNYATNVGTGYNINATIKFIDNFGVSAEVGHIDSSGDSAYQWQISARKLEVVASASNSGVFDGTARFYVEFKVSNVTYADMLDDLTRFVFSGATSEILSNFTDVASFPSSATELKLYRMLDYSPKNMSSMDLMYNSGNDKNGEDISATLSAIYLKTYTYVFRIYFTNANQNGYTVSISKTATANYAAVNSSVRLVINPRELDITATYKESYYYTGNDRGGIHLAFSGWVSKTDTAARYDIIGQFYGGMILSPADKMTGTHNKSGTNGGIVYVYAVEMDDYSLTIGGAYDNYYIESTTYNWKISPNLITASWAPVSGSSFSKTYDGTGLGAKLTLISMAALADWENIVNNQFAPSITTDGTVDSIVCTTQGSGANEVSVAYVVYTSGKNVKTYTAKIESLNTTVTQGRYALDSSSSSTQNIAIRKRELTASFTFTSGTSPYIYNDAHQGVNKIDISGFVSGEGISGNVSIVRGGGVSSSQASSTSWNLSGAVNVGEYYVYVTAHTNYDFGGTVRQDWEIEPYELSLSYMWSDGTTSSSHSQSFVYEALHQGLDYINLDLRGNDTAYDNITVSTTNSAAYGFNLKKVLFDGAVNTGTYKAILKSKSDNYVLSETSVTWRIIAAQLSLEYLWSDGAEGPSHSAFTYNTYSQGLASATVVNLKGSDKWNSVLDVTANKTVSHSSGGSGLINFTGAVNADSYEVLFASKSDNYVLSDGVNWTINKKTLNIVPNTSSLQFVYDGTVHKITLTIEDQTSESNTFIFNNDTLSIVVDYADGNTDGACNAGDYNVRVNLSGSAFSAVNKSGADTTDNYTVPDTDTVTSIVITARKISVSWSNLSPYVYSASAQGPSLLSVSFWNDDENAVLYTKNITSNSSQGYVVEERLYFDIASATLVEVGEATAEAFLSGVGGTNGGGDSVPENFVLISTEYYPNTALYSVIKSVLKYTATSMSAKVYDGRTDFDGTVYYTLSSTNGGAASTTADVIAVFSDPNAGTGKTVTFTPTIADTHNYELNASEYIYNIGVITRRVLSVDYELSSGYTYEDNKYSYVYDATHQGVQSVLISNFVQGDLMQDNLIVSALGTGLNALEGNWIYTLSGASAVGGYSVQINLIGGSNYALENGSTDSQAWSITKRPINVKINTYSGKAYMSYNNSATAVYAVVNNKNGTSSSKSAPYRRGQGLNADGFASAETSGNVIITASFAEASANRSMFDSYVNNVVQNSDGSYSVSKTDFYKKLVFVMTGDKASNYTFAVETYYTAQTGDNQAVSVFDSRDDANDNSGSDKLYISIEKYQVQASYSGTVQSYANSDNSYNTDWTAVSGSNPSSVASSVKLRIENSWMFEADGVTPKTYTKYTKISGRADGSTGLGAVLYDENATGLELNYTLKNQPTLIIGYFVSEDGVYKVGTLAGLLLATYYYQMNFAVNDPDAPVETVYTWQQTASSEDYDANTDIPQDLKDEDGNAFTTWDDYFAAYVLKYAEEHDGAQIEIMYDPNNAERGWGFWVESEKTMISYLKFKQSANISGVFTASDILILEGQFGEAWGIGSDNLSNFLRMGSGSVLTAIGAVFTGTFGGVYDGNGYVVDKINIIADIQAGDQDGNAYAGFFAKIGEITFGESEISSVGAVYNVHLRNISMIVNASALGETLYVGGIAGASYSAAAMTNVSFHGNITINAANATVYAGGILGYNAISAGEGESSIIGAVSIGNITISASAVYAGGVIGGMESGAVSDTVSMTEIFSKAASSSSNVLGGLIGRGGEVAIGGSSAYVAGGIVNANDIGAAAFVEKNIGNAAGSEAGISYDALRAGSNSAYVSQGGAYNCYAEDSGASVYDVISYGALTLTGEGEQISPRESFRIADIIDIYVLLYGKTTTSMVVEDITVSVYSKESSSWLVGSATGTSDNRIQLAYRQHVALLATFRFASFNLNGNITLYSGGVYSGAFYGDVAGNGFTLNLPDSAQTAMFEFEKSPLPIS